MFFLQDFIVAQVPAPNVDSVDLRKKFGAMVSSAIHSDPLAAPGSGSGVAALPLSKMAPVPKARADANVRCQLQLIAAIYICALFYLIGRRSFFCKSRLISGEQKNLTLRSSSTGLLHVCLLELAVRMLGICCQSKFLPCRN